VSPQLWNSLLLSASVTLGKILMKTMHDVMVKNYSRKSDVNVGAMISHNLIKFIPSTYFFVLEFMCCKLLNSLKNPSTDSLLKA
jgi:hypothetical protein